MGVCVCNSNRGSVDNNNGDPQNPNKNSHPRVHFDPSDQDHLPRGLNMTDHTSQSDTNRRKDLSNSLQSSANRRRPSLSSETKQILNDDALFSREAIRVSNQFWTDNVSILPDERRQEIGVTLYAQMFRKMPECRKIFLRGDIEMTAMKFLSMVGWLISELSNAKLGVWNKIKKLGKAHRNMGISYEHYLPMLQALHTTFQEQFPNSYTLRVKFCIESLFMNAAKIMTEKDFITLFAERVQDLQQLEFLDSLDACLAHSTGREYFERYLQQTFCAEYVVFLKAFDSFKQLGNSQQRYEKAQAIYATNFGYTAEAPIDLNKNGRKELERLKKELGKYQQSLIAIDGDNNNANINNNNGLDANANNNSNANVMELGENLLDDLYAIVKTMIEEQSWDKFCAGIYSIKQATVVKSF